MGYFYGRLAGSLPFDYSNVFFKWRAALALGLRRAKAANLSRTGAISILFYGGCAAETLTRSPTL
jgi:hypothetical protein